MKQITILSFLLMISSCGYAIDIKKVVMWGHKLHSHTHSYVHAAFYKAFTYLGYRALWLDNEDKIDHIDFAGSLFITEGQVDQNIPLRNDCWYILHNCESPKYKNVLDEDRFIALQVYTHDVLERDVQKIEPCIYYDIPGKIIYMPWATDLMPEEIEAAKHTVGSNKNNTTLFIGTSWGGPFGNEPEMTDFKRACVEQNIPFVHRRLVNLNETIALTQQAYMAPAFQGAWQVEKGYIPCRIFKNISYGNFGITNSQTVWELFEKKIIYHPDCYQLFFEAQKQLKVLTKQDLWNLMDFVKEKHTYLNRIDHLLCFFDLVSKNYT